MRCNVVRCDAGTFQRVPRVAKVKGSQPPLPPARQVGMSTPTGVPAGGAPVNPRGGPRLAAPAGLPEPAGEVWAGRAGRFSEQATVAVE